MSQADSKLSGYDAAKEIETAMQETLLTLVRQTIPSG
jgi:hypothetical protein